MKRQVFVLITVILLLFTMVARSGGPRATPQEYYIAYEIGAVNIIANQAQNPYNLTLGERTLYLLLNDSSQTVYLNYSNYNVRDRHLDKDGNNVATLATPQPIEAGEEIVINVTYHVYLQVREKPKLNETKSGSLSDIELNLKSEYCKPTGPWRYNQSTWRYLVQLANETLKGSETNVLKILYRFIEWIGNHVEYPPNGLSGPLYPNQTYSKENFDNGTKGRGDCDDQSNLLIAFCRIVGIPAYLQVGCIYFPTEKYAARTTSLLDNRIVIEERHISFHAWAMVYVPPWGWIPVDVVWGYTPSKGAQSAILSSVIMSVNAVALFNIKESDYVLENEEYLTNVTANDLRIKEIYSMKVLWISPAYGQPTAPISTIGAFVAVSFLIVGLYFFARRKRARRATGR